MTGGEKKHVLLWLQDYVVVSPNEACVFLIIHTGILVLGCVSSEVELAGVIRRRPPSFDLT